MHRFCTLLWVLWLPAWLGGATPLENVERAQALLGPTVWSRIIRVENAAKPSAYPPKVYALVFELGGILWFYTDVNGTQSFSLHRNNLSDEKADFGPLLRDIEPGFGRFKVLAPRAATARKTWNEPLPNGCLITSVAVAGALVESGESVQRANLVWFYYNVEGSTKGHTVLAYETADGAYLVDPAQPHLRVGIGERLPHDPLALARVFRADVPAVHARFWSFQPPKVSVATVARLSIPHRRAETAGKNG